MTEPRTVTVLDRLVAAGISRDRAVQHLHAGRVHIDGATTTDADTPAGRPARVVLREHGAA